MIVGWRASVVVIMLRCSATVAATTSITTAAITSSGRRLAAFKVGVNWPTAVAAATVYVYSPWIPTTPAHIALWADPAVNRVMNSIVLNCVYVARRGYQRQTWLRHFDTIRGETARLRTMKHISCLKSTASRDKPTCPLPMPSPAEPGHAKLSLTMRAGCWPFYAATTHWLPISPSANTIGPARK